MDKGIMLSDFAGWQNTINKKRLNSTDANFMATLHIQD
jgi:hypothetical protein